MPAVNKRLELYAHLRNLHVDGQNHIMGNMLKIQGKPGSPISVSLFLVSGYRFCRPLLNTAYLYASEVSPVPC
jgi:hypothetical protein